MGNPNGLGEYLRIRRGLVRPGDVGIPVGQEVRRVQGLRREEVAILAGISTEYYLRLEQGRETHPSDQVLRALARALQLDGPSTAYLWDLVHAAELVPVRAGGAADGDVQTLIDSWTGTAAVVHNRYLDVLATNALARELSPNYRVGVNNLVSLLTDPADRAFHEDWEGLSARSTALLRSMIGHRAGDARLAALVAELSAASTSFREAWERNDVTSSTAGVHVLRHPRAGRLVLRFVRLPVPDTDGHTIWTYHAEPGTPSAAALSSLLPAS
ncbi:helix-turn-helix domain-containing protein [Curtobacterium sp. ISL-83]|uniref:helix-turn-helix domain-containing protein n=1 Tax=Curtobacterium sp. ISL-83 TaxID=2819145 RepID=UPI001BEBB81E|nr:helix-turn-helix transcriptional regulator [Curtobacterium sp. ISL-83]MBT2501312.1 helix-turn-helix domain-containing protein [Curtobacterium sp. ISL-83]